MARNISNTARQAVYAPQTEKVFLMCIAIEHADLATPLRLVNNTQNIVHNGDTYFACSFSFSPPVEEDGTISNPSISIDNVDQAMTVIIRSISTPPDITAFVVMTPDVDTIEAGPWKFSLRETKIDKSTITGTLMYNVFLRDRISVYSFTANLFPGLFG